MAVCIFLAVTLYSSLSDLTEPAERTEAAATNLSESMHLAGDLLGTVPVIGGGVAEPFDNAAEAADSIALAREIYGSRLQVVPDVMLGFDLRRGLRSIRNQPEARTAKARHLHPYKPAYRC